MKPKTPERKFYPITDGMYVSHRQYGVGEVNGDPVRGWVNVIFAGFRENCHVKSLRLTREEIRRQRQNERRQKEREDAGLKAALDKIDAEFR